MAWNMSKAPAGFGDWKSFTRTVLEDENIEESHWLELKVAPSDKLTAEIVGKIGRFILGSANRPVEVAAEALDGCGVFILGINEGRPKTLSPVPAFEEHELDRKLTPLLGPDGPRWNMTRIGVEDGTLVIISVPSPAVGDRIHICRKDGEKTRDGAIYVRASTETRETKSHEFDELDDLIDNYGKSLLPHTQYRTIASATLGGPSKSDVRKFIAQAQALNSALARQYVASHGPTKVRITNQGAGHTTELEVRPSFPATVVMQDAEDEFDPFDIWPQKPTSFFPPLHRYQAHVKQRLDLPHIAEDPLRVMVPRLRPRTAEILDEHTFMTMHEMPSEIAWTATALELPEPFSGTARIEFVELGDITEAIVSAARRKI